MVNVRNVICWTELLLLLNVLNKKGQEIPKGHNVRVVYSAHVTKIYGEFDVQWHK